MLVGLATGRSQCYGSTKSVTQPVDTKKTPNTPRLMHVGLVQIDTLQGFLKPGCRLILSTSWKGQPRPRGGRDAHTFVSKELNWSHLKLSLALCEGTSPKLFKTRVWGLHPTLLLKAKLPGTNLASSPMKLLSETSQEPAGPPLPEHPRLGSEPRHPGPFRPPFQYQKDLQN